MLIKKQLTIPKDIISLLWSYDVSKLDPWRERRAIIVSTLNYGDLKAWQWLIQSYGQAEIKRIITSLKPGEIRRRARKLFSLLISLEQ